MKTISFTNTIANPRTMMIISCYAMITRFAVFTSQGLLNMTNGAIFVLNKENHIIALLFLQVIVA
jgi:hypothetical protein